MSLLKNKFNYEELIACAKGKLAGIDFPRLPLPPMLMFDRIVKISEEGGNYNKGIILSLLKNKFNYEELIACAKGKLAGIDFPRLPLPPMLMFDKIVNISEEGGNYNKGLAHAEYNITPDKWSVSYTHLTLPTIITV